MKKFFSYRAFMKKLVALIFLAAASLTQTLCQTGTSWFSVTEVSPKVWQISDHGADNMYVIEGRDSSLLVDTGLGAADLVSCVKKITSKPLIVVNTHGHPDHSGANYQFEKVYMHTADFGAAKSFNTPEARSGSSGSMLGSSKPSEADLYKGKIHDTRLVAVKDGYIFNLGGRRIQVMEMSGHTPGELCFLDIENKLLFTGDNNNTLVWLFLQNCKPLHEYLVSLEKQARRINEFTTLLPGHGLPMSSDFIIDQVACVKGILDGTIERKPYQSFAGNAMVATYGKASVAFNPDNL
jgi:glyoxylase-like metal-dependent hydrolase (beta-lactamase superfamily II)